jgi:hypothetical protein
MTGFIESEQGYSRTSEFFRVSRRILITSCELSPEPESYHLITRPFVSTGLYAERADSTQTRTLCDVLCYGQPLSHIRTCIRVWHVNATAGESSNATADHRRGVASIRDPTINKTSFSIPPSNPNGYTQP